PAPLRRAQSHAGDRAARPPGDHAVAGWRAVGAPYEPRPPGSEDDPKDGAPPVLASRGSTRGRENAPGAANRDRGRHRSPPARAGRRKSVGVSGERSAGYGNLVPKGGLEPPRVAPHAPQTCASASSATSAQCEPGVYRYRARLTNLAAFCRRRGSSASRIPSPKRLYESTVTRIASPGYRDNHQPISIASLPSLRMLPQ